MENSNPTSSYESKRRNNKAKNDNGTTNNNTTTNSATTNSTSTNNNRKSNKRDYKTNNRRNKSNNRYNESNRVDNKSKTNNQKSTQNNQKSTQNKQRSNNQIDESSETHWKTITNEPWNPEVGDRIEGYLIRHEEHAGEYNQSMYTLKAKDNSQIIVWGKTQLDQLIAEVDLDDYIRITYTGLRRTGNGHEMMTFNLEKWEVDNGD